MRSFFSGLMSVAILCLLLLLLNFQEVQSSSFLPLSSASGCGAFAFSRRATVASVATITTTSWTTATSSSSFVNTRNIQSPLATLTNGVFSRRASPRRNRNCMALASSFYGKFDEDESDEDEENDDDDDDDDEDEDDDYLDLDDKSLADFRSKMSNLYDDDDNDDGSSRRDAVSSVEQLINYARSQSADVSQEPKDWARPVEAVTVDNKVMIQKGFVLLANPAKFCNDFDGSNSRPNPALLSKFGLTLPPPADLGPDRRADLLPVLVIVEHDESGDANKPQQLGLLPPIPFLSRGGGGSETRGVLLNRRTGYLLGDLEPPPPSSSSSSSNSDSSASGTSASATGMLEKFCIQPLWFGGVDNLSTGLDMLHLCPNVPDAVQLTDDGLWWGGDPGTAQDCMSDPSLDRVYTGFDFKFFAQSTVWAPGDLAKQIASDTWFCAHVSKEVLFKSRDRMGTQRAKPLWTEIMELMAVHDVKYQDVRDKLYKNL